VFAVLTDCVGFVRLGIEGVIKFKQDFSFDPDNYSLALPAAKSKVKGKAEMATVNVFDKVRVGIAVQKDKNTLRGKVVMTLVNPSVDC
jgi:exosome complex exonuclease DIS3/RRP44